MTMEMMNILELVGAFLGGGGVTAGLNYWLSRKKEDRTDFERIILTWEQDNDRLRKENDDLRKKIDQLEMKIHNLEIKIILLQNGANGKNDIST